MLVLKLFYLGLSLPRLACDSPPAFLDSMRIFFVASLCLKLQLLAKARLRVNTRVMSRPGWGCDTRKQERATLGPHVHASSNAHSVGQMGEERSSVTGHDGTAHRCVSRMCTAIARVYRRLLLTPRFNCTITPVLRRRSGVFVSFRGTAEIAHSSPALVLDIYLRSLGGCRCSAPTASTDVQSRPTQRTQAQSRTRNLLGRGQGPKELLKQENLIIIFSFPLLFLSPAPLAHILHYD